MRIELGGIQDIQNPFTEARTNLTAVCEGPAGCVSIDKYEK